MNAETLYDAIGQVGEDLIDQAAQPGKKTIHRARWGALAAALALVVGVGAFVLPRMGGRSGAPGSGSDGASTFMHYAGPVFPLTLLEADEAVTAERELTLDFAPWIKTWWSNEEEAASRTGLTEEERQEVLDQYNKWFPEGGRWTSSDHILVTDSYTLTNTSTEDRTVTVLYPFASSLSTLSARLPTLTVDGAQVDAQLTVGRYAGGYEGAIGSQDSGETLNLDPPDSWEDYKALLSDGSYLENALGDFPDLTGIPVIVYEFTDAWGPVPDDKAGLPNPSIRAEFRLDYDKTTVLTYGFHGASYDYGAGEMIQSYSIPREGWPEYGEGYYLIVLGEDISHLTTGCYVTGGTDAHTPTCEGGVTVTRREADLDAVLRQVCALQQEAWPWIYGEEPEDRWSMVDFETCYGLFKEWLVYEGPLSDAGIQRYGAWLEDNDVAACERVFYLSAEVTLPAGGQVEVTAAQDKEASYDFACEHTQNQGISGYDMVTELGSKLTFTGQSAALLDRGQIEIVRQNFGFDLESGVTTVALDPAAEHYYLEVRRAAEPAK